MKTETLLLLAGGAFAVWYFFIRGNAATASGQGNVVYFGNQSPYASAGGGTGGSGSLSIPLS